MKSRRWQGWGVYFQTGLVLVAITYKNLDETQSRRRGVWNRVECKRRWDVSAAADVPLRDVAFSRRSSPRKLRLAAKRRQHLYETSHWCLHRTTFSNCLESDWERCFHLPVFYFKDRRWEKKQNWGTCQTLPTSNDDPSFGRLFLRRQLLYKLLRKTRELTKAVSRNVADFASA